MKVKFDKKTNRKNNRKCITAAQSALKRRFSGDR